MKRNSIISLSILALLLFFFLSIFLIPRFNPYIQTLSQQESVNNVSAEPSIKALVLFRAPDYFINKGVTVGFQYELLLELGSSLNKKIDFVVEHDPAVVFKAMFSNQYDIVVMDYSQNPLLDSRLEYSLPHSVSYPVLIGKAKGSNDSEFSHIVARPSFFSAMIEPDQLPDYVSRNFIPTSYNVEELFEKIDKGDSLFLVCDYRDAITHQPFYSNIKMLQKIGEEYDCCWVLKKGNDSLNHSINEWLLTFKESSKYAFLQKKYLSRQSYLIHAPYKRTKKDEISPYDGFIKKHAIKYGLDWRFVVSIMFQETKFQPGLIGSGGSFGVMQMMPVTAEKYGVTEESSTEEHIIAGIRYLGYLKSFYTDVTDDFEKMKFVAAAYNSGPGHIIDARNLCKSRRIDHQVWDNVAKYLILKSQRKYANDPNVKHGYYPGSHTVKYTEQVMNRYQDYLMVVKN